MSWDRDKGLEWAGKAEPGARDFPGCSPVRGAGRFWMEFRNSTCGSVEKALGDMV